MKKSELIGRLAELVDLMHENPDVGLVLRAILIAVHLEATEQLGNYVYVWLQEVGQAIMGAHTKNQIRKN